jgi:diaminopimelate epimerase
MEGAGNDFVVLDARGVSLPHPTPRRIRHWLDRHRGIGADGLLWIESERGSSRARSRDRGGRSPVRVRYWNADGGAAAFCGNGARCVARLLMDQAEIEDQVAHPSDGQDEVLFRFGRQEIRARRRSRNRIALLLPFPRPKRMPAGRPPLPHRLPYNGAPAWIDAGVPHWILPVSACDSIALETVAPPLRRWAALGPGGTNVDLVEVRGGTVFVRTFERGVEAETLACGSGLLAAGWWASTTLGWRLPMTLRSRGGDRFRLSADPAERGLWLEGPARAVYRGVIPMGAEPGRPTHGRQRNKQ